MKIIGKKFQFVMPKFLLLFAALLIVLLMPLKALAIPLAGIMVGTNSNNSLTPTGPVSQYYNGQNIPFRFATTNIGSLIPESGSIYINYTGPRTPTCDFFSSNVSINSVTPLFNNYTPPAVTLGPITQINPNTPNALWQQRVDLAFSTANSNTSYINFSLQLANNADQCSNGSTQEVFLSNGNNGFVVIPNHISIAAAQPWANITVTKYVDTNGDSVSDRVANAGEWSFSVDNGAPVATDQNGQVVFSELPDGNHTITESGGPLDYYFSGGSGSNCSFNNSSGTATISNGPQLQNASCDFTNSFDPNPAISIVKSGPSQAHAGDIINFSYNVTNDGNVALNTIDVTDNVTGSTSCPQTVLQPLESMICTDTYQIPSNQNSDITNTATVVGYYASGNEVEAYSNQSSHLTQVFNPEIHLVKVADREFIVPGDTINYTFIVTNGGNVPLANVTIDDPLLQNIVSGPTGDTNNDNLLDPSEIWGYTGAYTVPSPQNVTNTASVRAYDPLELELNDSSSVTSLYASGQGGGTIPIITASTGFGSTLPATGAGVLNFAFSIMGSAMALTGKQIYDKRRKPKTKKK